jgi:hypothetical protein
VDKLDGRVHQLQVERTRRGGVVLCSVAPAGSDAPEPFAVNFRETDMVTRSQVDLLRDAIKFDRPVRIAYRRSEDGGPHDLIAVRIYSAQKS